MRPRIVEFLNRYFDTHAFSWVFPGVLVVYGMMVLAGSWVFAHRCKRVGLKPAEALGMSLTGVFVGWVGGHLFYVLQNLKYTLQHPGILWDLGGDSISFGVYTGGLAAILVYSWLRNLSPLCYLDALASVLGLGPMIGRFACFLNGDDFGQLSGLPWAVRFPRGSYPWLDELNKGLIDVSASLSLPVHPVQLYGCIKGLVLFVLFTALWRKRRLQPGALFLLFWATYAVCRFGLEFFRGDNRGAIGGLSTGQYCSMIIFCFSLSCLLLFYKGRIFKPMIYESDSCFDTGRHAADSRVV